MNSDGLQFDPEGIVETRETKRLLDTAIQEGNDAGIAEYLPQARTYAALGYAKEQLTGRRSAMLQENRDEQVLEQLGGAVVRSQLNRMAIKQDPDVQGFLQGHNAIVEMYKEHNQSTFASMEQAEGDPMLQAAHQAKLQKLRLDPNMLADHRQMFTRAMEKMRAVDPEFDPMKDADFRGAVMWLNREDGAGIMESGEQQDPSSFAGRVAGDALMTLTEGIEGVAESVVRPVAGLRDMVNMASRGIMGVDALAEFDNYVLDEQGNVVTNEGEYPGFWRSLEMAGMAMTSYANEDIARYVAERNADEQFKKARANGFEHVLFATSRTAGFIGGIGAASNAPTQILANQLTNKGLRRLATEGSKYSEKTVRALSGIGANMAVNGTYDALAHGTGKMGADSSTTQAMLGLGSAFAGGMAVTLPIMGLGALGGRAEAMLKRKKMPKWWAERMNDAVVGAGLPLVGSTELSQTWSMLQNPDASTAQNLASSILGMMLVGAANRRGGMLDTDSALMTRMQMDRATDIAAEQELQRFEAEQYEDPIGPLEFEAETLGDVAREEQVQREIEQQAQQPEPTPEPAREPAPEPVQEPPQEQRRKPTDDEIVDVLDDTQIDIDEFERRLGARPEELMPDLIRLHREDRIRLVGVNDSSRRVLGAGGGLTQFGAVRRGRAGTTEGDLRELGMTLRRYRDARQRTPGEAESLRQLAAKQRTAIQQREFREATDGTREREIAREITGVRAEPSEGAELGSQRADPRRQLDQIENVDWKDLPLESEIVEVLRGDPGRRGVELPYVGRVGEREGDPVQVPIDYQFSSALREGTIGKFLTEQNVVKIKERGEIGVVTHEWSHAAMRSLFGIPNDYSAGSFADAVTRMQAEMGDAARAEIDTVLEGYDTNGMGDNLLTAEAWAETLSRITLGDGTILQEAPNLASYVQSKLDAVPQVKRQMQRAQRMIIKRKNAGATAQAMRDTGRGVTKRDQERARKKGGLWERITAGFVRNMGDEIVDLRRARDRWLKKVGKQQHEIDIMEDPVQLHDALVGSAGEIARQMLHTQSVDMQGNVVGESLADILRAAKEKLGDDGAQQMFAFINAHQTLSAAGKGQRTPITVEQAQRTIADLTERAGPGVIEGVAKRLKAYTDNLVDILADSGSIDAESAARIKSANDYYSPMYRDIPESARAGSSTGGSSLQRRKGSDREILDPIQSIERLTQDTITRATEAMVKQSLLALARKPGTESIVQVVDRTLAAKEIDVRGVLEALKNRARKEGESTDIIDELIGSDISEASLLQFAMKQQPGMKDHKIIAVNDNGKTVWLQLQDPKVYNAMFAHNPVITHAGARFAMSALRGPTEVLKLFATGVSPAFAFSNMVRDIWFKSVSSHRGLAGKLGKVPGLGVIGGFADYVRGVMMMMRLTDAEIVDIRRRMGGEMGQYQTELAREHGNQSNKYVEVARKSVEKLARIVGKFEQPLRIVEFRDAYVEAIERGMDEKSARLFALGQSKEGLVNFAKGGVVAKMLNNAMPYFKAGVVSQDKFFRHLRTGRGMTQMMGNVMLPSVLLAYFFRDNDDYRDVDDSAKLNYWTIPLGGGEMLYVPKPFEAGVLFGSLPQKLIEDGFEMDEGMRRIAAGAFLPYAADFYSRMIPQAIKPFLETYTGVDLYFGSPITPRGLQYSLPEDQVKRTTSALAQGVWNLFGGPLSLLGVDNPIETEKLMTGYVTTGAFRFLVRNVETMTGIKDHSDYLRTPVVSHFLRAGSMVPSEATNQMYKEGNRLSLMDKEDLTPDQRVKLRDFRKAKREISKLRHQQEAGKMSFAQYREAVTGVARGYYYE